MEAKQSVAKQSKIEFSSRNELSGSLFSSHTPASDWNKEKKE